MADYEVKIVLKSNLSKKDKDFIENKISSIASDLDIEVHADGITYSRKLPYKKLEDIPVGFVFYNKLRKYRNFFSVFEYYSFLEGDINGRFVKGKNEMIWLLAYGSKYTDDYDIDVGVFTDIDKLRHAYMEMLAIKEDELVRDGYSCIEQLKIFGFQKVNELIESALWENKISISPKEFGLPEGE